MALPKKYQSMQQAIASYNYTDIAAGTGTVVYYPLDGANATNLLTNQTPYGNLGYTRDAGSTTVDTFDLLFKGGSTRLLSGSIICSIPYALINSTGSPVTTTLSGSLVQFDKIDSAGTTTFIASGSQNITVSALADGTVLYQRRTYILSGSIPVIFKSTDRLRFTHTNYGGSSSTLKLYMGHDPAARTNVVQAGDVALVWNSTAKAEIHMPYKLDV